ncbi:MAG: hypothetical protein BHW56_05250 [Acetobacter sp. 46_36]|nr:MAG: hypothetical protein BHW56_05250 [Acetobacter sp. 46_36]
MKVTFLREEDIWGNNALEVMQAYGTKVGVSDVAIALGTCMGSGTKNSAGVASGYAWSASSYKNVNVRTVDLDGAKNCFNPNRRIAAGCPALPFSATSKICPNNMKTMRLANGKTVQICEYGAYPQTVAPKSISQELEAQYQKNALKTTGKNYTFDSVELDAYSTGFTPRNCAEYMFNGKRYVRIKGKPYDRNSVMSDGTSVQKGQAYWFEVQPIEWLMDTKGTWVSRQALFAGIQFDTKNEYNGNFANTTMYNYLQKHFAKEMEAQKEFTETLSRLAIRNRYFSNYVSGFENNKEFYPAGKDGQPFTPEKACAIVDITNAPPFMRDLLKLIAAFPKEEQGQFKDVVLTVFDKERDERDQPNEIVVLGKKLAVSGGYEKELNHVLQGGRGNSAGARAFADAVSLFTSRLGKFFGGR